MIRKYQPEIVIANAISDRHPDHGKVQVSLLSLLYEWSSKD